MSGRMEAVKKFAKTNHFQIRRQNDSDFRFYKRIVEIITVPHVLVQIYDVVLDAARK
jgi:hypothetical protein